MNLLDPAAFAAKARHPAARPPRSAPSYRYRPPLGRAPSRSCVPGAGPALQRCRPAIGLLSRRRHPLRTLAPVRLPYLQTGDASLSHRNSIAAFQALQPAPSNACAHCATGSCCRWLDASTSATKRSPSSAPCRRRAQLHRRQPAVVFSQLGEHTAAHRDASLPCRASVPCSSSAATPASRRLLSGRAGPEAVIRIPSLVGLSIAARRRRAAQPLRNCSAAPPSPGSSPPGQGFRRHPLIDTPPARFADAQTIAAVPAPPSWSRTQEPRRPAGHGQHHHACRIPASPSSAPALRDA